MTPLFAPKTTYPKVSSASDDARIQQDDLIAALKNRTPQAAVRLHEAYAAGLYGIIRRLVQDDVRAEKVLGLTLERVCSSIDQYNPGTLGLFTWINRIARQLSNEELSHEQLHKDEASGSQAQGRATLKIVFAGSTTSGKSSGPQISDAVEPKYRMILNLVYFQGFSIEEIAAQFSLPVTEVKVRLANAVRQLRTWHSHD